MKTQFWYIGKTTEKYVKEGMAYYESKIKHFCSYDSKALASATGKGIQQPEKYRRVEEAKILQNLEPTDFLVLLDERGKSMTSKEMATWLQKAIDRSHRRIIFLIGGAYGFSEAIYERAQFKISLSPMTFPHQLVRILFLEQLYRSYTIIHRKSYHH